jgi:Holliday junction DNA helicase RuvA
MIGKLTGGYGGQGPDSTAIIEVGGVGYAVRVPLSTLAMMRAAPGSVSLFVHTAVREDAIDLYGFSTDEELSFFKLLTSVSGIGPKSALGIINVADVPTLKRGIARGDASMLTKVYGIGKKSAERIVVELRDKLAGDMGGAAGAGGEDEVIEALMALGYSAQESRAALKKVADGAHSAPGGVRERLSAALKYLGSRG